MRILELKQLATFLRRRRAALDRAEAVARPIIEDVRKRGDRAVAEYSHKFDNYDGPLRLGPMEMARAWSAIDPQLRAALRTSAGNIERFARLQKPKSWMRSATSGVRAGQVVLPLASAGCYAPGGRFPLPSTVLMTAIPARVAGVPHVAVACPRGPSVMLAAAHVAHAEALYPVGGVQAIAAMAYGTRKISRADRIVGPGSVYVTAAKKIIAGETGIDFVAGPTEVVLVATRGKAAWLAADMIAQAEHDPAAVAILVTPSRALASAVAARVGPKWPNCAAVLTRSIDEAMEVSNRIAPEHLWLDDPALLSQVTSAGSVFLGPHTPVAAGDYATGPNHTLPTDGAARLRGGLSVSDFLKIVTVQQVTRRGLERLAPAIGLLARAEGLEHHARSIEIRFRAGSE
jgi:histidinol dehydrogenase